MTSCDVTRGTPTKSASKMAGVEIDAESHSHDSVATLAQGDLSRSLSGQPLPFLPYQFEPEAEDSDSDEEPGGDRGNEERLSSLNWRYRYIAYRRLVRWCWGWLGEGIRVVLPACAVTKIRETFPSEQYAGFRYPPLD
ncbi:Hypp569 [Branchiostoma lanceolatum]|uniref:Hypp569 protein n=1 Tax=Branchiostoma lanceolatum TaxID=7740 RepID=A0A8J9VAT8_BRALA|nr:Hypp569 [Branchiostoma lanceolatum]